MADILGDGADIQVRVCNGGLTHESQNVETKSNVECFVYLGETIRYEICVKKPKDMDFRSWKRRVSQLSAHGCVGPFKKADDAEGETTTDNQTSKSPKKTSDSNNNRDGTVCPVIATHVFSRESSFGGIAPHLQSQQSGNSYFADNSTYIIPMSTCVLDLPGQCCLAELSVVLWLAASPVKSNPEIEAKKDFQLNMNYTSTSRKFVQQTTVKNHTRQSITVRNLTIIPSSSPAYDYKDFFRETSTITERSKSGSWHQMVSPAVSGSTLPTTLTSCEELALIYRLDLSSVSSEMELAFHTHMKWTHSETNKEINTVFRLPKLRVRYPAFTVTVKCDGPVEAGKTFYLTYNIANNLQDFLSVRLYWNLDSQLALLQGSDDADAIQERQKLEDMKKAIICHDPDIFIGSCPRGCTVPVSVGFQILQPGLYEFGELMKLNLRWALPDSQSTLKQDSVGTPVSSDTVSTLSADDQLAASTELWRDRSGSTSSLHTPTSHSAEERRKSFATKSYSFGDLGPTLSADSDDACRMRFKSIKRSTAVMPPRPPPPRNLRQAEKDLTNRSNFLKKSFKIYIPSLK
ncbi:hypothetical protein BaRGS_00023931 [Batillaria attramentaria]|uniref:TRAPP14 C-terminal domain-containing protein n=1 Tax=Batillaria attramentaria TaxID=370345 RepID=A0ABD0KCN3_9CAEN